MVCYKERIDVAPPPIPSSLLLCKGNWHYEYKIDTAERSPLTCSSVDCKIGVAERLSLITVIFARSN
ncbi:Hypothetical predicted protein [Olea europaea subsp. europaea]|uniref:Uncharacterized protein n=1 Tax=Olea europaea subsp. europaea TaxID=158383 RepID=A0A8S0SQC0_OLEEU|nr:Hypothetical predicted protein [Olea europaea subsp. europaea]